MKILRRSKDYKVSGLIGHQANIHMDKYNWINNDINNYFGGGTAKD